MDEADLFKETTEEKIFGHFSFDRALFIKNNKYDVVDIRMMTCKHINQELDKDRLDRIINKMSKIFEEYIIDTISSNTSNDIDMSEDPIISSLLLDIGKLAMLYAAFSTKMIPCNVYGIFDLRPYNLSGINISVLNAGIFSRAGNQVRLSQIINQLGILNDTSFIEEYNKRINMVTNNTFNIMINIIASYLTPFGANIPTIFDRTWINTLNIPTMFDLTWLDENISFVQLIYRNLGGDDMTKQVSVNWFDPTTIPSLKEIHRNTIKFVVLDGRKLVFEYKNGTMKITKIYVHPHWIETLWNIVMLEMRARCEPIVGSMTNFYMGIIKTEEDFYLAYQLGIIYGGPMNFTKFHDIMYKISEISHYNSTSDASLHVKNLIDKVASLRKNALLQLYIFSGENMWMRVVNISAALILLLNMIQTVLSFMSYKASLDQCNKNNTFIYNGTYP